MNDTVRISVIIPTHNRAELLSEALDSVCRQSFSNWEAIIIDDASSPPVGEDLLPPDCRDRFRIIRQEPASGGSAAKDYGLHEATGEIVAFLDDDDLYSTEYLDRALQVLDEHPEIDVVFMGVEWFGENPDWYRKSYTASMKNVLQEAQGTPVGPDLLTFDERLIGALLNRVPMAFQRPVVRRLALERIGGYHHDCLLWDCDWAIRAAMRSQVALLNQPLYRQRCSNQGYSSRTDRQEEHSLSSVEIRTRLLREARKSGENSTIVGMLETSLAKEWFDLAYLYQDTGARRKGLHALWQSQRIRPGINGLKLLVRLILGLK